MTNSDTPDEGILERRSAAAFLIAGGLFALFAGLWGAFAFSALDSEIVQNVVGPAGWTAAFVGLLGLTRRIAEENPRLSRVAALFTGLGLAGAVITALGNFVVLLNIVAEMPTWFTPLQLLLLIGILLGFATYAIATLRADHIPQRVGLLLLTPAAIFMLNIVRVATFGSTTPIWAPSVLGAGQALALLAIGYVLAIDRKQADLHERPAGPTAK